MLTADQFRALKRIRIAPALLVGSAVDRRSAKALERRGLIALVHTNLGGLQYQITAAGRAALAARSAALGADLDPAESEDQRRLRCSDRWAEGDGLVAGIPLTVAAAYFVGVGRRVPGHHSGFETAVYRGVPKAIAEAARHDVHHPHAGLRPGDWIGLTRRYAAEHGGEGSAVLSYTVPTDAVVWAGTDENEWWYCPPRTG